MNTLLDIVKEKGIVKIILDMKAELEKCEVCELCNEEVLSDDMVCCEDCCQVFCENCCEPKTIYYERGIGSHEILACQDCLFHDDYI